MTELIFKVIGGAVVIIASASIGAILAGNCSSRVYGLRTIQNYLKQFENEIVFMANPLSEAFFKIGKADDPISAIFRDTAGKLSDKMGMTACEAWIQAIRKNLPHIQLNNEDVGILDDFGKMLGSSDRNGQVSNIAMTVEKLKAQETKAEETRRKYESMYKKLGILGGLAIVVLLF